MSMIRVENLTFSYPSSADAIFNEVSFQIDTDWKLGFIGRNGRGKTTFMHLLLGKYEYKGKIISAVPFDYFPFEISDPTQTTERILSRICPAAQEWELIRELSYLKVRDDVLWRSFASLSKGEQTKVLLAALFLKEEHFLLIDEPTNHLDETARRQIAEYLKKKKGNFSTWMENFERQQRLEMQQNERLKKEIVRMKGSARQAEGWSHKVEASKRGAADKGYVGHKAAKMMKKSKNIEARREKAVKEKAKLLKNVESVSNLKIAPAVYHSNTLVSFSDVAVFYDGCAVCQNVTFDVCRGDRVMLQGKNGRGKSSLLKLIMKNSIEHTGTIARGSGLVISYVPQDTSGLKGTLAQYAQNHDLDESLFKTILRKMDVERVQFEKNIEDFSAGQKKKVLISS